MNQMLEHLIWLCIRSLTSQICDGDDTVNVPTSDDRTPMVVLNWSQNKS